MLPSDPSDPVEQITLRVRDLEINITVRAASGTDATSSVGGFQLVGPSASTSGVAEGVSSPPSTRVSLTARAEEQLPQTTAASELSEQLPEALVSLAGHLRADHAVWGPRSRIARAFRAGIYSHRRLAGIICEFESPVVPFRNTYYLVLRCVNYPSGFWTINYQTYLAEVGRGAPSGVRFHPDSVSHAFASRAEGEAFLAGALRSWPTQLP